MSTFHEAHFEGIVIGHQEQGDADRLVSFYTPRFGKIETIARGVRYEKSKLKGHLELLMHGEFIIARNRGRGVLTDALSCSAFPHLCSRPETAYLGLAIVDMYDTYLYPHAPDESLWHLLTDTLEKLNVLQEFSSYGMLKIVQEFAHAFVARLGYADSASSFVGNLQQYDALLAHSDIAGPTFACIERGVAATRGERGNGV